MSRNLMQCFDRRFISKFGELDGCWVWVAANNQHYGVYTVRGRNILAHRFAYQECYGEIPEGYHVDHLCRNKMCVNPDHLEAVTPKENTRRMLLVNPRKPKTHCPHGHAYTEENTYVTKKGSKTCKICRRNHDRRRKGLKSAEPV